MAQQNINFAHKIRDTGANNASYRSSITPKNTMKRIFFLSVISISIFGSANATNFEPGPEEAADTATNDDVVTASVISNAVQGDPEAQYLYGNCYYYGKGEEQSFEKAIGWWNIAADQNYEPAITDLGYCYMAGEGVEADSTKALELFLKAADLNYAPAQFWAGYCYKYGIGTQTDYKKANKWFEKAADSYVALAMFELGDSYEKGLGYKRNTSRAIRYYEDAAEAGEASATERLKELKDDPDRAKESLRDILNKKAGKGKKLDQSKREQKKSEDSEDIFSI